MTDGTVPVSNGGTQAELELSAVGLAASVFNKTALR